MSKYGLAAMKAALLRRALAKYTHLNLEYGQHGYLEPVYQRLFLRELAQYGLADRYTPIQSAANYSLLYVLLTSIVRAQPANVLELGCGQTTLLLNALRQAGVWRGKLTSLEQDDFWCEEISSVVDTEVIHAPLTDRIVCGQPTRAYDLSGLARPLGIFDFVLIDGPTGSPRYSRLAALEFVPEHLAREYMIILDDYERPGEKETAGLMRRGLADKGVPFFEDTVLSNKHQLMIATGAYRPCLYPKAVDAAESRPTAPRKAGANFRQLASADR